MTLPNDSAELCARIAQGIMNVERLQELTTRKAALLVEFHASLSHIYRVAEFDAAEAQRLLTALLTDRRDV